MARNHRGACPQSRDGRGDSHAQQWHQEVLRALRTNSGQSAIPRGRRRGKGRKRLPDGPRSHMSVSKPIALCASIPFAADRPRLSKVSQGKFCQNFFWVWPSPTMSVSQLLVTRIFSFKKKPVVFQNLCIHANVYTAFPKQKP